MRPFKPVQLVSIFNFLVAIAALTICLQWLTQSPTIAKSEKELIERFIQADVIVIVRERIRITQTILEALPKLKLISLVGRHSKMIDFEACTKLGIPVAHGVGSSPLAPAELTLALIFAARRNVVLEASRMQAGQFPITLSHRIHGSTLGIFGLGVIGEIVAKSAQAIGMQIVVWGRKASLDKAKSLGYGVADSKESFFSSADVISLHLRYSKETQGIVQESDLALMKPTALIVNTARAELIASGALENALNAGRPGFAAVDVYENEPYAGTYVPLKYYGVDNFVQAMMMETRADTFLDEKLEFHAGSKTVIDSLSSLIVGAQLLK